MHDRRFWLVLVAAVALRVAVAATTGYPDDRIVFAGWASVLASQGPLAIYGRAVTPLVDYSPGYLYVLWAVGVLHAALGGGAMLWRVLLEIVPIGGDLALIAILYRLALAIASPSKALVLASVLAFAPPLWIDSAVWGQADSLPLAFALLALGAALRARASIGWPWLALAVVVKPLVVVLAPLAAYCGLHERPAIRIGVGIAGAFAIAYVTTLPFTTARAPVAVLEFLAQRYAVGAGKAPFVTEGAFSMYPLLTSFFTPDSARVGPITFHALGVALVVCIVAIALVAFVRAPANREPGRERTLATFAVACVSLLALFVFATRMHERYLLPALVIGAPLGLDDRPSAAALGYLAVSFTVNCVYSLAHFTGGAHHPLTVAIGRAFCALNVLAFAVLAQRMSLRLYAPARYLWRQGDSNS